MYVKTIQTIENKLNVIITTKTSETTSCCHMLNKNKSLLGLKNSKVFSINDTRNTIFALWELCYVSCLLLSIAFEKGSSTEEYI